MIYEYKCFGCNSSEDIIKPAAEYDRREYCPVCKVEMKRVDFNRRVFVSASAFEPHFNHGLGKIVHSKRQMREELRTINAKTGMDLQEVGNDRPHRKKMDRRFKEETLEAAGRELYRMRGK